MEGAAFGTATKGAGLYTKYHNDAAMSAPMPAPHNEHHAHPAVGRVCLEPAEIYEHMADGGACVCIHAPRV
jgi:hypothetical protein